MTKLAISPADVRMDSAAETVSGLAQETIVAGQTVGGRNGEIFLADANDFARSNMLGFALCSATKGQPLVVQKSGFIELGECLKPGQIYVLSATAGGLAPAADVDAGWFVTLAGVAISKSILQLMLNFTGVRVPDAEPEQPPDAEDATESPIAAAISSDEPGVARGQ